MKGFITTCVTAACLAGGLSLAGGCDKYQNLVDPCYPERYNYAARQEVRGAIVPQSNNGHVLDQTVWNYHFETGTDKLTPGGMEHLAYLARRRPSPDPMVFLQTAQDIPYDAGAPDRFGEMRASLDTRRIQAIQNYLNAQTSGRHVTFEVAVHDPGEVGVAATPVGIATGKYYLGAVGNLPVSAGAGASNVAGGGGAAGGAGGGGAGGPPGGSGR